MVGYATQPLLGASSVKILIYQLIQEVKMQTLIHFYDSLNKKASILIAAFPKTETVH